MPIPSEAEQKIVSTAKDRLATAMAATSDSRDDELDDLRFYAGSPDNMWQWPSNVLTTRGVLQGQTINARPCLTINKLPQHVRQVTNDQRQNRPSIKVIPVDDKADVEVAEKLNGMVRHIEYISDADVAYDTACENQVAYGEGYFRILTDYCDDDTFNQDIKIGRIRNSFSVYMDPMIQDPCGADAKWALITEDVTLQDYEREWPDATPVSTMLSLGVGDDMMGQWIKEKTIRIAEYFYIEYKRSKLNLYSRGETAFEGTPEDKDYLAIYGKPKKSREVNRQQVKWCKTNGYEILEESDWAGSYIPIIRVVGNEFEIDGQMYVSGIVRNAKDAQRMYNYWTSQEAEMLALAPKAPFIGYAGQFEGFEDNWKTANVNNWPYLEANADPTGEGTILPLPQRSQPPMAQTGLIQAKAGASEDIKSTTGQYDASLGVQSNERSAKAILARERQVDVGTYHYVDNLARAIRYAGRQIVELIPKIYDVERMIRIVGVDGEVDKIKINPEQEEPIKKIIDQNGIVIEKIYNPGVGKYDVCVTTGPSYMTKRQEALEGMFQLLQGNPDLWRIAGDLFAKEMDWPGAQEISRRIAKTIDPKLIEDQDESPALQVANQQIQQMDEEMNKMHQMLQNVSKSLEVQASLREDYEAQIKAYDAETKRLAQIQASMSPEQIQDIVLGTVHSMMATGDLMGQLEKTQSDNIEDIEETQEQNEPSSVIR